MNAADQLTVMLERCVELSDAERILQDYSVDRMVVWGLFDGWSGRPLSVGKGATREQADTYKEHYAKGRQLKCRMEKRC